VPKTPHDIVFVQQWQPDKVSESRDELDHKHNDDPQDECIDTDDVNLSPELAWLLENHPEDPSILAEVVAEERVKRQLHELQRDVGFPSYATFVRARYDPEFNDVKKREQHFQ